MRIAVVTYFYPKAIPYATQLLDSLHRQTQIDFNLLVFNDGVPDIQHYFQNAKFPITYFDMSGSISAIRINSLRILGELDFDGYVFADADDTMSQNRVSVSNELLMKHDIVVSDLSLTNADGLLDLPTIWASRLPEGFEFDSRFLRDKNIVGFGNSAIKRAVASSPIADRHNMAPDWYIFYQIIEKRNLMPIFTSRCQTMYRQHDGNMAGIRSLTKNRLEQVVKVKQLHYTALEKEGYRFTDELRLLKDFSQRLENWSESKINIEVNPFWWEETNFVL